MSKKGLLILGLGAIGAGIYIYGKAKKKANEIKESTGDAVSNKVGEVTESILTKVMQGSSASDTSVSNSTLPPAEVVSPTTPTVNTSVQATAQNSIEEIFTPNQPLILETPKLSSPPVQVASPSTIEEIFQPITPPALPTKPIRPEYSADPIFSNDTLIKPNDLRNTWDKASTMTDLELVPSRLSIATNRSTASSLFNQAVNRSRAPLTFGSSARSAVDGWQNMIN